MPHYFITGVTGFLGQELLRRLRQDPATKVTCFIRSSKKRPAQDRFARVMGETGEPEDPNIDFVEGDLRRDRMGIGEENYKSLTKSVTNVIHSAADVRFNQPLEKIRENNVGGSENILRFAEDCKENNPEFSHLDYVSTAFVAGRRAGVSRETELVNSAGWKNTYEQTKFEAEEMARQWMGRLPIVIHRPSIVLGFSEDGRAKSRNVIYPMLKLFRKWKMPVLAVRSNTRLDMVPVDYVAAALLHISAKEEARGKCFHLAAGPEGDVTLGAFLRILSREFDKKLIVLPPAVHIRIIRPFLKRFRRDFYERSTRIFRAFEPYIWEENPRYSVELAREFLADSDIEPPDSERFFRACVRYAIESDFGEKPPARSDPETTPAGTGGR